LGRNHSVCRGILVRGYQWANRDSEGAGTLIDDILLVAWWTGIDYFRDCADKLTRRCVELEIPHHIKHLEVTDTGNHRLNGKHTAGFILECLEEFRRPLFYVDVDTEINCNPLPLLAYFKQSSIIFATPYTAEGDWGLMDFCHFINYTPEAIAFIQKLKYLVATETTNETSHTLLTHLYYREKYPRLAFLPSGYSDGTIVKLGSSPNINNWKHIDYRGKNRLSDIIAEHQAKGIVA
jgi:hypothetical protein